jgi:hypothetical protein
MTKRTRVFVFVATGVLIAGLGTGLVASYMGLQGLVIIGGDGPAELAYVPADAQVVAFANVRDIMDSDLRQKLLALQPGGESGADQFREETGIDLRTDVDQVVATITGAAGPNARPLVLARGNFDTTQIESLIRQKGGVVEDYQGRRVLTFADGSAGLSFVEPGLVAVGGADAVRRAIDTKDAGTDVTDNADLMRHVRDIDSGNAWAVARFDAIAGGQQLPADLANQLPPISWFSAGGYVNGGIRGVVRVEARDETAANDLRDVIRGFVALARMQTSQRAELAELMNSLELAGEGTTVSLGFSLPPEVIDALAAIHAARPRGTVPDASETPAPPADPSL